MEQWIHKVCGSPVEYDVHEITCGSMPDDLTRLLRDFDVDVPPELGAPLLDRRRPPKRAPDLHVRSGALFVVSLPFA